MGQFARIVLDVVEDFGGTCPLDEVSALCPELTDTQVFQALEEFNQSGEVRLLQDTQGTYFVRVSRDAPRSTESRGFAS